MHPDTKQKLIFFFAMVFFEQRHVEEITFSLAVHTYKQRHAEEITCMRSTDVKT